MKTIIDNFDAQYERIALDEAWDRYLEECAIDGVPSMPYSTWVRENSPKQIQEVKKMDWIYVEAKYKELQLEMDKAFDKWNKNPANDENYRTYIVAKQKFSAYCVDILAKLMEENKDVLERLKNA